MLPAVKYPEAQQRLGQTLRGLRESRGLTQERAALDAGLHRAYIGGLERGEYNVTLGVLVHLAAFYKVSASSLLEGIDKASGSPVVRGNKRN